MPNPLFEIADLKVAFPSRQPHPEWAVNEVSLTLQPGERLGLVGESGCGKSTLGRAAMRLLPTTSQVEGEVKFEGESVLEMNSHRLRQFRGEAVALVFQDPMTRLDPLMSIGQHCIETLLAHQPQLSRKAAKTKSIQTLEAVNISASRWSQYPHEFSGGMRQRVAIALALLLNPKLIVADEPTTSLDVTVSAQILQELMGLCQQRGTALLLISHDLAMVGEYCDRIAVMNRGKIVEMGPTQQVFQQPQHQYTQSLLEAALHLHEVKTKAEVNSVDSNPPLLQLENLQKYYALESGILGRLLGKKSETIKAVDGVNLTLYSGEILGLVGESGCGKSTLSRTLLQLIRPTGGRVVLEGTDLAKLSDSQVRAYRQKMQMVFQDPHACLNPMMTVGESIAHPLLIHKMATATEAKQQTLALLERVGLTPTEEYYKRYPAELSGGQQQRVAIARALITRPELLICDEPVSMLDASVQAQVLALMLELKQEFGLTYLFITHDLWVARYLCDRIAVMNSGKIVELGNTHDIFNTPQHPYTKILLNAAPLLSGIN
ncbi:MAG: ABC transporter ATP-binding protein [Microcoleaceae cyanobacterium]